MYDDLSIINISCHITNNLIIVSWGYIKVQYFIKCTSKSIWHHKSNMHTITFAMLAFFCAYLVDNTIGFKVGGLSDLKMQLQKPSNSWTPLVFFFALSFFNFLCNIDSEYVKFYITNSYEIISLDIFPWETTGSSHYNWNLSRIENN